jgi:hypothetical protein
MNIEVKTLRGSAYLTRPPSGPPIRPRSNRLSLLYLPSHECPSAKPPQPFLNSSADIVSPPTRIPYLKTTGATVIERILTSSAGAVCRSRSPVAPLHPYVGLGCSVKGNNINIQESELDDERGGAAGSEDDMKHDPFFRWRWL